MHSNSAGPIWTLPPTLLSFFAERGVHKEAKSPSIGLSF